MPELDNKIDDNIDDNVDDNTDDNTDDNDDSKEDSKDSVLKEITDILKPDEVVEDKSDDKDADDSDVDDDSTAVDDEFKVLGWDEDVLNKIKDIDPKLLDDVKGLLNRSVKDKSDSEDDDADDSKVSSVKEDEFDYSSVLDKLKGKDSETGKFLEALVNQVQTLTTSLNTVTTEEQERKTKAETETLTKNFRLANSQMDELSKDFPVLGKAKELPRTSEGEFDPRNPSVRERTVIWNTAMGMFNSELVDNFEDAVKDAITLYKGKNAENLALRDVVKDLNKRQKKFTARPSHKQTQKKEPTKGTDEFKIGIVADALKAAGIGE